jgi:hypothetical protein
MLFVIGILIGAKTIQAQTYTIVEETALKKVIVPTTGIATGWFTEIRWTGTGWTNSRGGAGYENETGYGPWMITDLGSKMYGSDKNTTCYIRLTFSMDPGVFNLVKKLFLNIRYDDGFVAWLNGQKIAEANAPSNPAWNSAATQSHEAGDQPETFDISADIGSLMQGNNLLAVQGLNDSNASPDFLISVSLSVEVDQPLESVASNLPIVKIDTHGRPFVPEDRIAAQMDVIDNGSGLTNRLTDPAGPDSGPISIEIRGASSACWPKKQYNVETQNADSSNRNVSLLGLPKDNDWILYGPYIDKSLLRNTLGYWLSNRTGLYASRTRFCELTLNGLYQGVYVLMEKIKQGKDRVPIAKLKETDNAADSLTGGYILKIDRVSGPSFASFYPSSGAIPTTVVYQYHDPPGDKMTTAQKQYIQDFIHRFEDVMAGERWTDPDSGYAKWINTNTFADYFFVNEIAKNVDAWRLSTFMYKDRDDRDGRLCMGPVWDLDLAFGNDNWYDGDVLEGWDFERLQNIPEAAMIPFWWPKLFTDSAFRQHVRDRWTSLRQDALSMDSIRARIEAWADSLGVPAERNFSVWAGPGVYGGNGCFWPVPDVFYGLQSYRDEIDYLEYWVDNRLRWMDAHMNALPTTVDSQEVEPVQSFVLGQNYPNPFNQSTVIPIVLEKAGAVRVSVFNVKGERVWETFQKTMPAGRNDVIWQGKDSRGSALPSGNYHCTVHVGTDIRTIKLVLLK